MVTLPVAALKYKSTYPTKLPAARRLRPTRKPAARAAPLAQAAGRGRGSIGPLFVWPAPFSRPLNTCYGSAWKLKCIFVFPVLGQIPAELDPETRSNGSGLKNGAEREQNQPRSPIIMLFHCNFVVHA